MTSRRRSPNTKSTTGPRRKIKKATAATPRAKSTKPRLKRLIPLIDPFRPRQEAVVPPTVEPTLPPQEPSGVVVGVKPSRRSAGGELPRPLSEYGLARDYYSLTGEHKMRDRKRVLTSWFDTSRPQMLCTDTDAFIRAYRLWVDHYLRTSPCCSHWYHYPDPDHKEEMVRLIMSPPIVESLPSKTVEIAPRGTGKTVSLFVELFPMIAICRPYTPMIMSQAIKDLTAEKIGTIRAMIEDNTVIHSDFGGEGRIWPKHRMRKSWNTEQLDFIDSGSVIKGVSIGSKHRGRHPLLGLIDDPDDGKVSLSTDWRRAFFQWLLAVYCPMFSRGGHIGIIQTATNGLTPAFTMIHAESKHEDWETVTDATATASRGSFFDWRKKLWALHVQDQISGEWKSLWEAKYPAAQREHLKASLTEPIYMAEMQGQPMTGSVFMFRRHPVANAYMICNDYVLDIPTNTKWRTEEFLSRLSIVSAADPATDEDVEKCFSAAVVVGIDPDGLMYVLDCYNAHVDVEEFVRVVISDMSVLWKCSRSMWEKHGLQTLIIKMAEVEARRLRIQGITPPEVKPISSSNVLQSENLLTGRGQQKIKRIIGTLKPSINTGRLRFRVFGEMVGPDGEHHVARYDDREEHHALLKDHVDSFTERGGRGKIDLIDALEMGIRTLWSIRGTELHNTHDPNEAELEAWEKAGVSWDQTKLPATCWTRDTRLSQARRRLEVIGGWTFSDGGYVPPEGDAGTTEDLDTMNPYSMYG